MMLSLLAEMWEEDVYVFNLSKVPGKIKRIITIH